MNICLTLLFHVLHNIAFLEHICEKTNPFFIHFVLIIPTMGIWLTHNIAFVANTFNPRLLVFLIHFHKRKKHILVQNIYIHIVQSLRKNGCFTNCLAI